MNERGRVRTPADARGHHPLAVALQDQLHAPSFERQRNHRLYEPIATQARDPEGGLLHRAVEAPRSIRG